MIKGIVCCTRDWAIGKVNKETGKGELLFNIPADMQHFKEATTGNICVFGYNTYMSLPKRPLKNRINIVLWDKAPSIDCLKGAITFSDFSQLVKFIEILAVQYDVYICGGASVYKAFLPYYDEIDVTFVDAVDAEATAFFPNLQETDFDIIASSQSKNDETTNGYTIQQTTWAKL